MDLNGKVALVTGAARRIGREIALTLADAGCDVAVHYHASADEAAEVVAAICSRGRRSAAFAADLADPATIAPLVARVAAEFAGLDVLINNAAIFERDAPAGPTAAGLARHMAINVSAPALLALACRPIFLQRGRGCIVNIADIYAARPLPDYVAYCASKAALLSVTRSLARSLAPAIRVNAVAPGAAEFPEDLTPAQRERIIRHIPLGREIGSAQVAEAVLYLVRDAECVAGQTVVVDGGRSIGWAGM